jgi:hypothetical protein
LSPSRARHITTGDRVVCLSDYHNDLPEGLLSQEEQEEPDETENNGRRIPLYSFAEVAYDINIDQVEGEDSEEGWKDISDRAMEDILESQYDCVWVEHKI